jgi:hypothetical protein
VIRKALINGAFGIGIFRSEMGLYAITCIQCKKPFMWFSGTLDQRCERCFEEGKMKHLTEKELEIWTFINRVDLGTVERQEFAVEHIRNLMTTINSLREECEHQKEIVTLQLKIIEEERIEFKKCCQEWLDFKEERDLLLKENECLRSVLSEWDEDKSCYVQMNIADNIRTQRESLK